MVRDKDGISAALLVVELAAGAEGRGPYAADRLDELAAEFGVHATAQMSLRVDDLSQIAAAMARLRAATAGDAAGRPVTEVEDLRPDADVLMLRTDRTRVVVRPSRDRAEAQGVPRGDRAGRRRGPGGRPRAGGRHRPGAAR